MDKITEANFFAAASAPDAKTERGRHCEAWYFGGMKRLLAADKNTASDYFRKWLTTEELTFNEYGLAQAELKMLTAAD